MENQFKSEKKKCSVTKHLMPQKEMEIVFVTATINS